MSKFFMDQIEKTANPAEIWRIAVRLLKQEGFVAGSYDLIEGPNLSAVVRSLAFGYSAELVNSYRALDYARLDLAARHCLATGEVLTWNEAWALGTPTPEERAFREKLRSTAMADALVIPCFGPKQRLGYVTILPGDGCRTILPGERRWLQSLAQACHLRLCEVLFVKANAVSLSPREREILHWVARGKSNSVIAQLVSCSSNTVDTHLRRTYAKMEVSDRTTAAIKAIGLGLIS